MNEFHRLQARFFEEDLNPEEASNLAERLDRDPAGADDFLRLYAVDRLLRVKFGPRDLQAVPAILSQIKLEQAPFVQEVLRDIKDGARNSRDQAIPIAFGEWLSHRFALPRWAMAGTALIVAALIALSVWFFGPAMGEPMLSVVHGGGVSIQRGTEVVPVIRGISLLPADIIRLQTNSSARIIFGRENTQFQLGQDTELKLVSFSRGKRFELRLGRLEAKVALQRAFKPMVVITPHAEARVLGTHFLLATVTNVTRLEVIQGKVKFTRASDGKLVKVGAGNYAVAAANYELTALPQTGRILREYWTNMPGMYFVNILTSHPDFPDHPSGRDYLNKFEGPSNWSEDYGARICGYLHPPRTGVYTFWIAAPSASLWLSSDDDGRNATQIATAQNFQPHEWTKDSFQQSATIRLVAGRRYYIEVLQKHGRGADHLAVAWQAPGDEREIIPGKFLSPLKPGLKEKKP